MGNRLSKIYTRTGDDGTTGLGDGSRTPKESRAHRSHRRGRRTEQHARHGAGGAQPAGPGHWTAAGGAARPVRPRRRTEHPGPYHPGSRLTSPAWSRRWTASTTTCRRLREFILPSGGPATAACHLARAIARRAERRVWQLSRTEPVAEALPQYLNRLSDLLFVLARVLVRHERGSEVLWRRDRGRG